MNTQITKTLTAQTMGQYKTTSVDAAKAAADFRLISVSPYIVAWNNGTTERVTARQLKKLQAEHTWSADF
jgi:hypothetical protein